ncbi:hypothetical protein CYY_001598 [Polysphondylium violaceum]|uniref:FNIP repeat-containing protein n=1 Tax=Polysphondylium violaceum TaxID=133409 RepID=A0A8J4Q1I9_9MYCE|nr:hypothetical protein CYY_001598 [Polysphondylium violaceum]
MDSNQLFFTAFRDGYLRSLITDQVIGGGLISITLSYLNINHKHLYLLDRDTTLVRLNINQLSQLDEYLDHPHRELINSLYIEIEDPSKIQARVFPSSVREIKLCCTKDESESQGELDVAFIPSSVSKIDLFNVHGSIKGCFSDSVTEITIGSTYTKQSDLVDSILANLPSKLEALTLFENYPIQGTCPLPETCTRLFYTGSVILLSKFQPSGKEFQHFGFGMVQTYEEFSILSGNSWIKDIGIKSLNVPLSVSCIPSSIRSIDFQDEYNLPLVPGIFPESLQDLVLETDQPLGPGVLPMKLSQLVLSTIMPIAMNVLPPNLTILSLNGFNEPLSPNVLPSSLVDLHCNSYKHPLEVGVLPSGLKTLGLSRYDSPLSPNVLPCSLKELNLFSFQQSLGPNIIPSSTTKLTLNSFNQPLVKDALPKSLIELNLPNFNKPLDSSDVLPSTLEILRLDSYSKPFPTPVSALESLKELNIASLNKSTLALIPGNIKNLSLGYKTCDDGLSLPSTLTVLNLVSRGIKTKIGKGFIPSSVKSLRMFSSNIQEGSIPEGVGYLKMQDPKLEPGYLPQSLNYLEVYINSGTIKAQDFIVKYKDILPSSLSLEIEGILYCNNL